MTGAKSCSVRTYGAWRLIKRLGRGMLRCLALAVLFCRCSVTDTGNPTLEPTIDAGDVAVMAMFGVDLVQVIGGPGAIEPPLGVVRATNLDSQDDFVESAVASDGSFQLMLLAGASDLLRLQVIGDSGASATVDIDQAGRPVDRALDCLVVEPEFRVSLELEASVDVQNSCADSVAWTVELRRSTAATQLSATAEQTTLGAGEASGIALSLLDDFEEEVIFVTTSTPEVTRHAITIGRVRPP